MTPPPIEKEPPLSAPDLVGPTSILNQPVSGPRGPRRRRARPYRHVRLGVTLEDGKLDTSTAPVLRRFESVLREREVVEGNDLWAIAARCLHAFAAAGYQFVDRWSAEPGGELELPGRHRGRRVEPVGHLLRAVQSPEWAGFAGAKVFSVHLTGSKAAVADVEVRRVHRERRHAIRIDLNGLITPAQVERLAGAVRERLPVRSIDLEKYTYAD